MEFNKLYENTCSMPSGKREGENYLRVYSWQNAEAQLLASPRQRVGRLIGAPCWA